MKLAVAFLLVLLLAAPAVALAEGMEPAVDLFGTFGTGQAAASVRGGPVTVTGWHVFQATFDAIIPPIQGQANGISSALAGWIRGWLTTAATLVLLCLIIVAAMNNERAHGWVIAFALRAGGVAMVAAAAGGYQQWVAGPLLALPNELTPLVAGTGTGISTGGKPFDDIAMAIWSAAMTLSGHYVLSDGIIALIIAIGCVGAGMIGIVFVGGAFACYLLTYFILTLLVAIGPIFVAALLARITRNFFSGWLNAVASQLVALLLIAALLGIMMKVILAQIGAILAAPASANTASDLGNLVAFSAVLYILYLASRQISAIATGMVGGIASQWMPMVVGAGRAAMAATYSAANSFVSSGSRSSGGGGRPAPAPAGGFAGRSLSGGARP